MLNNISRTPTFERDWKRLKRKHYDPAKLRKALQTLMAEDADTLQREYRDHALKGEWLGFRELHIEGDWLLSTGSIMANCASCSPARLARCLVRSWREEF